MNYLSENIIEALPAGIVVTDQALRVRYMNDIAKETFFPDHSGDASPVFLSAQRFYNTDRQPFDMQGCMQNMLDLNKRVFHKTLIMNNQKGDFLVYLSAKRWQTGNDDVILFVVSDLSDEMDCIAHSPGTFKHQDFFLSKTIIGHDEKIRQIHRMITLAAGSPVNVLVSGESGTGKELVADAIHQLSDRKEGPLVKVNCSALSDHLLESELFGHVKGAFTGAIKDRPGRIEEAHGGTLFLDEIGEISPSLQVKLLRVLQEKTIERVGDNRPLSVDMRIIAATNRDLVQMLKSGQFREDLYYRLNVFSLSMPPLRERPVDIPLLVDFFVDSFREQTGKQVKGMDHAAMRLIMEYHWPGNIRELQNAIEYAFVLVQGPLITANDLPETLHKHNKEEVIAKDNNTYQQFDTSAQIPRTKGGRLKINKEQLHDILDNHDWNQTKTAAFLGISRVALWKKMKKMGL